MSPSDKDIIQTAFWRGDFGTSYTDRNKADDATLRARVQFWSAVLGSIKGAPPASILEVGANLGINLRALRTLTGAAFHAVEPNAYARSRLINDGIVPAEQVYDSIA